MERAAAPVGRHLAAAAGRIGSCADRLQKHRFRCDTKGHAEGAIAIVGEEPVVAAAKCEAGTDLKGFMPCTGYLEEDFLLALEQDLAVVDATREKHETVDLDELLRSKASRTGIAGLLASSH